MPAFLSSGVCKPVCTRPAARCAASAKATTASHTSADQNLKDVHKIVSAVRYGSLEINDAVEHIVDMCRTSQQAALNTASAPEFLDARGMHAASLAATLEDLSTSQHTAAACHVSPAMYAAVRPLLAGVTYHAGAQMLMFKSQEPGAGPAPLPGAIAIVSSASAEEQSAEECKLAAKFMGCYSYRVNGLTTGSIPSLLAATQRLQTASVLVVCAGRDAALPGVLAGMVEVPVIALPGVAASPFDADPVRTALSSVVPGVVSVAAGDGIAAAAAAARSLRAAKRYIDARDEQGRAGMASLASRDSGEDSVESGSQQQQQQQQQAGGEQQRMANNVAPAPGLFHGAGSAVPEQQVMKQAMRKALELMQEST